MKISELSKYEIKDFLRIDYFDDDALIEAIMSGAKAYIMSYTGLNAEQIDDKEDLTIAFQVLIKEMYTFRQYTVDKNNVNRVVDTILNMHSVNLL